VAILVEDVPAHGRGVGTRWSLRSLPTLTILWYLRAKDAGSHRGGDSHWATQWENSESQVSQFSPEMPPLQRGVRMEPGPLQHLPDALSADRPASNEKKSPVLEHILLATKFHMLNIIQNFPVASQFPFFLFPWSTENPMLIMFRTSA